MDLYWFSVKKLKKDMSNRDLNSLPNFQKCQNSLQFVSLEHRESIVCSIFDRKNGLLHFLNDELREARQTRNQRIDKMLKEAFQFLTFIIENLYTTSSFVQYIHEAKDVCQFALIVKCPCDIRKAAYEAFIKLIELLGHNLNLVDVIKNFCKKFVRNVINMKERRFIFSVIGKIMIVMKHNGSSLERNLNTIVFRQLRYDASQEYNKANEPNTKICENFHIYFDALADMLDGGQLPDAMETLFCDSYGWIKDFCLSNRLQSDKYKMSKIKPAVNFLRRHMNLFQDLLFSDYMYWHDFLQNLSSETGNYGDCGRQTLKKFYQVIGQILKNRNEQNKQILEEKFVPYFRRELQKTNLDSRTLRLIVYGFSQMAAPCKVHNCIEFNLKDMYFTITSCALPLCSSENSGATDIESICFYQEALSEILCHMTDVTIEKINILVQLGTYVIKRYPDLASSNALAASTLTKTINNLATVNKGLLQRYLDSIIYDGVAWSCSHTLALDAELQQEFNNLEQSPVCYKNYLPLWMNLLNAETYRTDEHVREQLARHVADTMINVCIMLINRLNIHVKRKNEDTVLSDVALTQSAVNQADFRVFANLVDLYVDVLDVSNPKLFANTVHRFLYEVIRLSYKYPLISGFYKLIRVGMKIFNHTLKKETEKSAESRRMEELLSNYLWYTLDLIPAFSNELLIACLYLILNTPFTYVKDALPRTLPAFKIAFTVGLSNLELAYTALTALEVWTTTAQQPKRDERTNELLREIVAYLEPYLRSTESSIDVSQDLITARKRVKRVDVIDTDCTLRNFQRRVLLFLGSLDHDLLTSFVHERASLSTGASWDRKNLIKYSLPLPDTRLDIYFDRMLPRIIALARDSSDRRTKIAACEVLHSMMTVIIGSTARFSDPENSIVALYGTLCQTVLVLGCDPDEVVCGLFHPLALQLMHWFGSKPIMMSSVIDSIFNGLIDDSNPALREFSGTCLAEFTASSIEYRQPTDVRQQTCVIIERINNLALHPSTRKRVAAAVAFNHLYRILRENDDMVSTYWLEIFYCFIRSLDGCDDPSITNALTHIEKVMEVKADLLKTASIPTRRKPHEFDDATLIYALYWLLSQCGVLDEHCRAKCMELYVNVSKCVNVSQCVGNYAQETTRNFVDIYGINLLNDIILKGLESNVKNISVANNVIPLLKALDCYVWLIDRVSLPVEMLFPTDNVDKQTIFLCIHNFACQLWRVITERSVETAATAMKSREFEQLQALQCKVLMTTLNFVQVLLNANANIPELLWDEPLSALTIRCIMHPRTVGFDVKNIEMTHKLPHVLETLLNSMKSRYRNNLPNIFKKCLLGFVQECVKNLLNLQGIAQNDSCDDLIQHVNGLILLKRYDMLDQAVLEKSDFTNGDSTVTQIFQFLVSEHIEELACKDLSARMIEYLRTLMEFQFSLLSLTIERPEIIPEDVRSMMETLTNCISDDTSVTSVDSTKITRGEHFLNTFRSVIFKCMLTHVSAITDVFDDMLSKNPSFLLKWVEDLLLFLKQHRRELQAHVGATVDVILKQFNSWNNPKHRSESHNERLINIYSIAVHLMSNPTKAAENQEFYNWIRCQLVDNHELDYKTKILKNFFVCFTDVTDFEIDLRNLKTDSQSLCLNLSETSVNAMKVINCFETMLVLLSTTKSMIMLNCVMHFAAGAGNRLFNEKLEEHLRGYYCGASLEHVLESLNQTYLAFINMTIETERLDILHGFLLPAFKFCDATTIERFFERNVPDPDAIDLNINLHDDDNTIKQKIVSKIGCFQLISIIFARVDKNKINANVNNAQNQLDQVLINRDLYLELFNKTLNIRALKIDRPGCQKLVRLLHCSAYNCLLAIISLKEEERFYSFAFGENSKQGRLIWQNIIDCSTRYKLGQTVKEYPKTREITVNIRSAEVEQRTHRYTYVHTYDLSTCTLSEDINAYDLNNCVVLPADFRRSALTTNSAESDSLRTRGAASIALKYDDFNEHECMPYICVLLRHIRKMFRLSENEPKWLKLFLDTMQRQNQLPNIELFMLKIISNTADEVFKPYARFALTKIIRTIANYLERYDLNYIITDVLEILMDWHDVAVPDSKDGKDEAQRLFEKFIDKVLIRKSNNNRVYDYNLSLLRIMVAKWHSCLRVPTDFLNRQMMKSAPTDISAAVYLILVLLDNNMTDEIVVKDDIVNFLLEPLKNWDAPDKDVTALQCCECLGLYLRALDGRRDEIERDRKKHEVKRKIFDILCSAPQNLVYMIKKVKRIAVLCETYPEVAVNYINIIIDAMPKCLAKNHCLEIFILAMPNLDVEDIEKMVHGELLKILKDQMSSCEKIALRIIRDMVAIVLPKILMDYLNLVVPYVKNNVTEHRELVYDILIRIYKKCSADITLDDDATVQNMLSISMRNLLAGLLDPSHDLQDKILKFWTEETNLATENSKDRLIKLLAMHSPQIIAEEDAFALFVALLMLQLTTKSIDYTRNIFDGPLNNNYSFEEYKIAVSWRRRNLSCITPMFVDSLASQMSYSTFSQSVDNDLRGTHMTPTFFSPRLSHGIPLRLRATQDLQFEPTAFDDDNDDDDDTDETTMLDISSTDDGFNQTIPSSSRQSLQIATGCARQSTRILENSSAVANNYRNAQIRKNKQQAEKIMQEIVRQRSNVKLYRPYRIGNFPDIEISYESFIVPLQQLIKLDRLICKDVTVSLFHSLIKEITKRERSNDFSQIIVENFKRILHNSCERDSSFNAVILETLLQLSHDSAMVADCDPRDVMKASKANQLNALGVLFVERGLLRSDAQEDEPTSSKMMRRHDDAIRNEKTNKWTQLASLYKSLNDVDVVLSIFRGQSFDQDVQEAALAEVNGDWIGAKDAFTNAYKRINDSSIKEHCLQGLLEAVNNLCDWSEIDRLVKSHTRNESLSGIWNDEWRDWMIPYACDAYVHMSEERVDEPNNDDVVIQSWIHDQNKLQHLMPVTGENLVIFLLKTSPRKATDLLNDLLDMMGKRWVGLSPLCTEMGIRILFKLQIMNDLDASLKVLRCTNKTEYSERTPALLNFLSMKKPTIRDNLIQWNKLAAYRAYSSKLLQNNYRSRNLKKQLDRINYDLRSDIINAALNQKHRHIAKKHLNYIKQHLNYIREADFENFNELELSAGWLRTRVKSLSADFETDMSKKVYSYAASWKYSLELLKHDLDADTSTSIREHISTLTSKIETLSRENATFARELKSNNMILQNLGIEGSMSTDLDIREHLLRYSLNNLRSCCQVETATNIGRNYCALARHCYDRLMNTDTEDNEIFQEFLLSILRSMRHDYLEAAHYFPCLLRPERLQDDETRKTFIRECDQLRPWLFLRWRDLLFSHLGTPSIATAIVPIVERLVEAYPDAIAYNYHLTIEKNPSILQDENMRRIHSFLHDKARKYKRFLQAIEYVVQPPLYLNHYLDKAMKELSQGKTTAIESLLQKIYSGSAEGNNPRPGTIFGKLKKGNYESYIRALSPNNLDAAREGIRRLKEKCKEDYKNCNVRVRKLEEYSPFLQEYVGGSSRSGGIEIPGQYTGDREPMHRYHVKIARFEPLVEVMQSLRKPIRIGMVGDNGREYKFLVKFGEDLTIDRGLQQLYSTMNRTLRNDPGCRQRRLAIDTYEVIPLSSSFGLIQWIEDTKSLDDLVQFTLSKNEKDRCRRNRDEYARWIQKAAPTKQRIAERYKEAVVNYSQQKVTSYMNCLINTTRKTALRDTFNTISPSPECFVTLRRNFVASYATMCVAHWLAGIGDRHLQNTLVHVATGRCLGIDFGHAFGSGIRAQIPELVPFRLTPQILELLLPFTERDLLATIMTHAMRALRDDRGPILACMDIFIHKPAQRSLSNDEDIEADLTWSSKKNIEIVAKKLNGIHPSIITLEQLKETHDDDYFERYSKIVTGNDEIKQARVNMKNDRLTPTEQVDCLLDQAKDLNILGRMYENWQSWL